MTQHELDIAWKDRHIAELEGVIITLKDKVASLTAENTRLRNVVEVLRAAIREHVIGVDGATIHERDCYLHPDSVWKGRRDYCSCEHNSLAALVRGREQTNG